MKSNINECAIRAIKQLRIARGVKQTALSEVIGCSECGWSRIERGERPLTLPELDTIADYFSVSLADLLGTGANDTQEHSLTFLLTIHRVAPCQVQSLSCQPNL